MVGEATHKVEKPDFLKKFNIKKINVDAHFSPTYHYDDDGRLVLDTIDLIG